MMFLTEVKFIDLPTGDSGAQMLMAYKIVTDIVMTVTCIHCTTLLRAKATLQPGALLSSAPAIIHLCCEQRPVWLLSLSTCCESLTVQPPMSKLRDL